MDVLKLLNGENNKYANLLENILRDEIVNNDQQKLDHVEKVVLTTINTKLEHANTHCQGLNLLSNFLSKISKESLTKFYPHWIAKIIHILNNTHSNSQELIAVCNAIKTLIVCCKDIAEIDKRISIYIVKQLIGIIHSRYLENKNETLLHILTILLYYYPESCSRFQASLSSIISSCVDERRNCLVHSGAKCYSLLVRALERTFNQLCKNNPAVIFDNNNINCHIFYQISLCHSLHSIMNELFKDIITANLDLPYDFQDTANMNILVLPKIPCDDILGYYTAMERRFTNICIYLSASLKIGGVGKKKYVSPNLILQIICQGLSITPINFNKNNDENRKDLLLLILPKLHIQLLNVLESLIISFQQELLSSGVIIQRLILQIVEWTQQFNQESYKNISMLAYKILSVWLKQTRSLSGFQFVADEFLKHLLKDISPTKNNILVLKTKKNKKFKKDNSNSEDKNIEKNGINCDTSSCKHPGLCLQIVLTVQSIISNTNHLLKGSFYEEIQNTIVSLLYDQYVNKKSVSVSKINIEFRLELLRTLRILGTYAHNLTASPISYAIQIFGIVISQDNNPEIIEEASLGMAELRYIVNPTAPSLMLPLDEYSTEE